MSDITERLGSWEAGRLEGFDELIVGDMQDAKAEIERLREECAILCDEVELKSAALTGTSRSMGEEIERLREEVAPLRQAFGLLTTLKPDMEIDVLDPVGMAQQIVEYVSRHVDLTIAYLEVAALRAELADATSKPFAYCTEPRSEILARQQAEIERLRDEVQERNARINKMVEESKHLKELKFQMAQAVLSDDSCGGDWRDGETRTIDIAINKDAEIERLRGLLRDYMRAAEDPKVTHDDFQDGLKAWEKRVREALGGVR